MKSLYNSQERACPPSGDQRGREEWMRNRQYQERIKKRRAGRLDSWLCGCGKKKQKGVEYCPDCHRHFFLADRLKEHAC